MRPPRLAWAAAVVAAAATLGILLASRPAGRPLSKPAPAELPGLWKVPAFSYPDQDGRTVTDRDLRGRVWISDFFFTSCTSICPTMTAAMARLQKAIPDRDVQFVSFSVDPEHDTPERLRQYAGMWKADLSRWHFLATEKDKLAATAAGMKTAIIPAAGDEQIGHSVLFSLVDRDGMVRGVYDSSDPVTLRRLAADARSLAGGGAVAGPQADWQVPRSMSAGGSTGAGLYVRRGCLACHAQARVAPPLEGLLGRKVLLNDGRTVTADEAYVRESILDPEKKVVAGYPNLMPSYRGLLRDDELADLVAYIATLEGNQGPGGTAPESRTASARESVDPVCKMKITAGQTALEARYLGRTYRFCSETCRETFLKDPVRFAGPWDSAGHPGDRP
jgi:protein SCO1/2